MHARGAAQSTSKEALIRSSSQDLTADTTESISEGNLAWQPLSSFVCLIVSVLVDNVWQPLSSISVFLNDVSTPLSSISMKIASSLICLAISALLDHVWQPLCSIICFVIIACTAQG